MEHASLREFIPTTSNNVTKFTLEVNEEKAQLAQIDTKLAALRAQLNLEQLRRDEFARAIELKESLCAPIHRMPAEILGYIFEYCADSSSDGHGRSTVLPLSLHNPPLIFTRICWRWRSVALATPAIWRVVNITTETLQSRSVNLPLVLPFWSTHAHNTFEIFLCRQFVKAYSPDLVATLRKLLGRCRILFMDGFDYTCFELFPLSVALPLVEELTFGGSSRLRGTVIHAPRLHTLKLKCGLYTQDILELIPSSSNSLHCLEVALNPVYGPDLLYFLSRFPELRRLKCEVFAFHSPPGQDQMEMPHLTHLDVRWDDSNARVAPFFNTVKFSSLQELSIRGDSVSSGDRYELLVELTNISFSRTLTSIILELWDMESSLLVWENLPALEKIYLRGCCGLGPVFAEMSKPMEDGSWLCPKLREISLFGWPPVFLKGVLPQITDARGLLSDKPAHKGVVPLEIVEVWVSVYPEDEEDENISDIRATGVTVNIRGGLLFYIFFSKCGSRVF